MFTLCGERETNGSFLGRVFKFKVLLITPKLCSLQMATSKVENSAQVFVLLAEVCPGFMYPSCGKYYNHKYDHEDCKRNAKL
jgi:hypothetical protein